MITIEALTNQHIDPTDEQAYRAWSAHYNHALQQQAVPTAAEVIRYAPISDEAIEVIIKAAVKPAIDANMMVKNWVDLRCECRQKVAP